MKYCPASIVMITIIQAMLMIGSSPKVIAGGISSKRIPPFRVEQFGAYHALFEISQKANIPIGLEVLQTSKASNVVMNFPGGTVEDLLNAFTAQAPGYTWTETSHGVFHVSLAGAHVSLLDVVMSYPGAVRKTRQEIWEDIAKRPEVVGWMSTNECSRGELFHGREFRSHNQPISVQAGPQTVEHLLDEVALKSGVNYWAVIQSAPANRSCDLAIILW